MSVLSVVTEYSHEAAPRSSHIDAHTLNADIHDLLKSTLLDSVQLLGLSAYTKLEPEIDAILKWLVYRFLLVNNSSTVGHNLLQVKYSKTISKRLLGNYALALIFFPWLHKRFSDACKLFVSNGEKRTKLLTLYDNAEILYKILHIVNLLVFLREGMYSTIGERFFRLKLVPTIHPKRRQISYTFFSRELSWNGFTELLGFILPLIPTQRIHSILKSCLPKRKVESTTGDAVDAELTGSSVCMVCGEPPILPYQYGCDHVACHYCLYTKHSQEQQLICNQCGYSLDDPSRIVPVRYNYT